MTREQAFWLMVVAALVAVFAKSFRAPSDHFWDAPPRIPISEEKALDILAKSLGAETAKSAPAEDPIPGESLPDEDSPSKETKEEPEKKVPPPDPKPKRKPKPKPAPAPEPKEPRAALDKEAVNAMVTSVLPDLFRCYRYFMDRAYMNVDGQVVTVIEIDARGTVTRVTFAEDPLKIPRMEECVASKLVGKEINPPPGEPVVARYPLMFTHPGAPHYDRLVNQIEE